MKIISLLGIVAVIATMVPSVVLSAEQEVPDDRYAALDGNTTKIVYLEQNWTPEESHQFYYTSQGSHILPYDWFLVLEREEDTTRFFDAKNMLQYGYLAQRPTPGGLNPDGLPVGFVKDPKNRSGVDRDWLGFTCAACHTQQINYKGTGYRIDGAATLGDVQNLLVAMTKALKKTHDDDAKFNRFAAALNLTGNDKVVLKAQLELIVKRRDGYNQRNFLDAQPAGHGRIDAFGAILNEVCHHIVKDPVTPKDNANPCTAPVSYPCLWDTPQHDCSMGRNGRKRRFRRRQQSRTKRG